MLIAIIILIWLLVNTWLSIIICQIDGNGVADSWLEILCLALASIFSPLVWLGILALVRKIKK